VRSPGAGTTRRLRAVVVAVLTVALASGGHVVGGGHRPHPLTLVVLTVLAALPAYLLGRHRVGAVPLLALLGGGQFAVHHVLSAMESMDPVAHDHLLAGHAAHGAPEPTGPGGLTMLAAHAAGTLVTGALLARGEAAVWALWHLLAPLFRLHACAVPAYRPLAVTSYDVVPAGVLLVRPAGPRGPPRA
jgi:hypothetical protein